MNQFFNKKGFSLIELLVVLAILAVLAILFFLSLRFFQKEKILESATQEIVSVLRFAQNRTLASEGASSFGVYFEADKFTLFKGASFDVSAPDNEVHELGSILLISEINLGGFQDIIFERLTGVVNHSGSVKIEISGDSTKNRVIFIDPSGTVSLSSGLADDTARIKDSRHIHVLYSQNTKIATTLYLVFPDDSASYPIDYKAFLNPAKDQFYWEDTVVVNGVSQSLKIHTHQLSDASTLFCIHRDRRLNSKALNIFLDSDNLINYDSSGAASQGSSVWVGAPEPQ